MDTTADEKMTGTALAQPDTREGAAVLEARGLGVTYGSGASAVHAVGDLTFEIRQGEFVCIVGPSGCGKTTLLKALAGLLRPTRGGAWVAGKPVDGPHGDLALVFQDYTRSLMPWMSVKRNVTFPLAAKRLSKSEQDERARSALAEVGLSGFEGKYPWQLSGGMQQRVAIARAIAYRPAVLLMDEPFAAVDAQVRADLEDLILRIQEDTGVTVLLVTHDIDESVYLGGRVLALTHRPTSVKRCFDVPLPYPRSQIETRAMPEFVELRTEVLRMIQAERLAHSELDDDAETTAAAHGDHA
ncbi:MAG TPA: ABC transporter ATP-binding protein [Solirubrobacteraceae bacterium]|nr:ABC transporter ATP-binding protein [Solirubrobacteraceae bacterium]